MYFSLTIVITSFLQIIQNTFKLDEMRKICSDQLDDKRRRRVTATQTLSKFEHDLADVKKKLLAEEQARKSVESTLEGYQKQAKDQGNRLREANAELKKAQEQVLVLKKHLEETQKLRERAEKSREEAEKAKTEAERAMNEAKQRGYEVGIAETEEALRAEVPVVCRIYCAKTWDEALTELRLRLHLSYGGQRTYSILRRSVPQLLHPIKLKPLLQSLIPMRRFCLKVFLPLASQNQLKGVLPLQELPRTRLQLLLRQRRPPKVFNKIWLPRSCQLGELLRIKRKSLPWR